MPPKLLIDLESVDLNHTAVTLEEIQALNPQRYEFAQITKVCHLDMDQQIVVAVRELTEDEFWVRGHMPGRPIFPGVLMIESAAQLCSIYMGKFTNSKYTYGFGGADNVKFRRMVGVGDRVILIAKGETVTPRRSRCSAQGIVDGKVVFEAKIFGIALPPEK